MKKNRCLDIFLTFLKIGAFTFGGGYAMIPLIKREIEEKKKWLSDKEIFDIIAIAESTPGPLAVNAATFVGFKIAGTIGAICATLGVVLPSFLIIVCLSKILQAVENMKVVSFAFTGIRAGVLVLISTALFNLIKQVDKNVFTYIVIGTAFLCVFIFKVSSILVLLICAVAGIVRILWIGRKKNA